MNVTPKKYRTVALERRGKREARARPPGTQELVLTLSVPDGEVIKVETVDKSGKRQQLSEEELADLVGEDDVSPEEVYAAAIPDASVEDELELDQEGVRDEEALERLMLREMIGDQLLRRGMRRLVLRRLRKREIIRQQQPSTRKAAQKAEHQAHKNGHERKVGG